MLKGRRRFVVVSLAWCVAVFWCWREFVPLAPTTVVRFSEPMRIGGFTENGELRLSRLRPRPIPPSSPVYRGPIEYWRLPEGRKVREVYTETDFLHEGWSIPGGVTVLERSGVTYAASDATGEMICELSRTGQLVNPYTFSNGGRLVYSDADTLRLHDLKEKRELWAAKGYSVFMGLGPDFLITYRAAPGAAPGSGITYSVGGGRASISGSGVATLDLETGQPLARFDHLGVVFQLIPSPNGRFVVAHVVGSPISVVICDARTGAELWRLPLKDPLFFYRFENSDDDLCSDVRLPNGELFTARWKSADGTVLVPFPKERQGFANLFPLPNSDIVLHRLIDHSPLLAERINRWLSKTPLKFRVKYSSDVIQVVRASTGQTIGFLPSQGRGINRMPDGSGFLLGNDEGYEFYSIPPSRNWWWLFGWGLIPPGVGWVRRRWRLRRQLSAPSTGDVDSRGADASGSRGAVPQG